MSESSTCCPLKFTARLENALTILIVMLNCFGGTFVTVKAVDRALKGVDAVYHLAAAVGAGQSMYEVEHYTSHNDVGTAVLLETLIKRPVERLIVVASSMSIYGEGLYRARTGFVSSGIDRSMAQLGAGIWDLLDDEGNPLADSNASEQSPALSSVYALSKHVQERMCLMIGRAYKIPTGGIAVF